MLRVAVIDDFEIVVAGVARMLEPFDARTDLVEINANEDVHESVDIALFDTFAQGEAHQDDLQHVLDNTSVSSTVIYTWNFDDRLVQTAKERGIAGYLSKSLPATELVDALESIGDTFFISRPPATNGARPVAPGDWPGRALGLTERESEVLALIVKGADTQRMADLMFLSPNSIKTHLKSLYRKIDAHSRSEAILWGLDHGFRPKQKRIQRPND